MRPTGILVPRVTTVRRDAGPRGYERALARAGLTPVAGIDEAGRGACAGPLVAAAVVLPEGRRGEVPGLADSKLLNPTEREEVYLRVLDRAVAWAAVVVPPATVDSCGLHRMNQAAMRRSLARLSLRVGYALTDGFPVAGMGVPSLAVWKGDRVSASISAASVVAKVTRDRIMIGLHDSYPSYGFSAHKGYVTPEHQVALWRYGPCPEHRFSYVNVARAAGLGPQAGTVLVDNETGEVTRDLSGHDPDDPAEGDLIEYQQAVSGRGA